ncbi:hypothetical protein [Roseateles sp.]|uniref:hypothetical protein n=1 Tax=Roseateles sp. TaxID=1971397 RepID=UPI002F413666
MTEDDLAALERLPDAAQRGPWASNLEGRDHESGNSFIKTGNGTLRGTDIELSGATVADQDFIAAARQTVQQLIDEIRKLRRRIDDTSKPECD